MKLSTQTSYVIAKYGMEEGIRALAKAGYDAIDYSFFDMNDINDDSSPWLQEDWREGQRGGCRVRYYYQSSSCTLRNLQFKARLR